MAKDKKRKKKDKTGNNLSVQVAPKKKKMKRVDFEKELEKLQVELCHLQAWVKKQGLRVVVIFEGRDAAGKGGVIRRITERVSPRVFRVVALPAPTEREKTQLYLQRYIAHLPAAGEVVIFDRSWYNRAGIEHIMGFCTQKEYETFLRIIPNFERELVLSGITLIKYFLDVDREEQERRLVARIEDPMRQWKLSGMDVESWARWWDYTKAYDRMMLETDTPVAPWHIVNSTDKRRARLNCISHLLSQIPYKKLPFERPPKPKLKNRGPDTPDKPTFQHMVPEKY
jgi:polyphosphate kinase 2